MSTDDSSRRYIQINLISILVYNLIRLCLIIISLFKLTNLLVFIHPITINSIKDKLFKDGYELEERSKFIYVVHPVLYERK